MENRRFYSGVLNHCYQRTADNGVLFYTDLDHLIHFTYYCLAARKYGITVFALCQMPDHIHDSVVAQDLSDLSAFKREVNSRFSRDYNSFTGRSGPLFESPFGSAPKRGDKAARSNIVYVGNNPVERHLCAKAKDYRWNYLAYGISRNPFSERRTLRQSRPVLKRALVEIQSFFCSGKPINYSALSRLMSPLDSAEKDILADSIVSTYNVIDYDRAAALFGGFDNMLIAMNSTTGSEYDIKEVFTGRRDSFYKEMNDILLNKGLLTEIHALPGLPYADRKRLFPILRRWSNAPSAQIEKYLHLSAR